MFLREAVQRANPSISFEFFPPKTDEGEDELLRVIREDLAPLGPTFVSCTYGAGGSTRDRTLRVVARILAETDITPVAHLTTVGVSREDLCETVQSLYDLGVRNILALRGDPPQGEGGYRPHPEGLPHALDLVRLIKAHPAGRIDVGVTAFPEVHPEAPDMETDVGWLRAKAEAGADVAVTQFFFEARHYRRLVETARRLGLPEDMPIIPGIMPVTNVSQIKRFAELSGAEFPGWLADRLHGVGEDPAAVRRVGVEAATELCRELLDGGAPGLHFYTLNRSPATREIAVRLGLSERT